MTDASGFSVLFVDDDPQALTALRRLSGDLRASTRFVRTADEALEQLAVRPADVVVSDHQMPGMDGLTFLRRVRVEYPRAMCVLHTARLDVLPLAHETIAVFVKPCRPEALRAFLSALCP